MNLLQRDICGMARMYPMLYPQRRHTLNQLYCTIGSGYDWHNGKIKYENVGPRGGRYYVENKYGYSEGLDPELETKMAFQGLQINTYYEWYPLSTEYSPLLNIPRDTHHDYLDGAVETAILIYNTPYSDRYYYPMDHYQAQRDSAFGIMMAYPKIVEELYEKEQLLFPERSDTFFS